MGEAYASPSHAWTIAAVVSAVIGAALLVLNASKPATLRSRPCNCSHGTASYLCSKYVFRVCSCKCRHDVRHRQSHTLRCSNVCVLPILHYCLLISSVYSLTDNEKLLTAKK